MNEFDMDAIKLVADMLRDSTETAWAQSKESTKEAKDALIKDFEFFLKGSPSAFKILAETPTTDKERDGFYILMKAIMHDATNNFIFFELAGGKERLIEYLNSIAHRISALESQNKLLMETISSMEAQNGKN